MAKFCRSGGTTVSLWGWQVYCSNHAQIFLRFLNGGHSKELLLPLSDEAKFGGPGGTMDLGCMGVAHLWI